MNMSSSLAYRRFLNDYYIHFNTKHLSDVICFLEQDDDHTFDQYLVENEISYEIESAFSHVVTAITKELSLMSLDWTDIGNENGVESKVNDDVVKMIKGKLKGFILDSQAYYHLAGRIV